MLVSFITTTFVTPLYNVIIHGACLGWNADTLVNGLLSNIVPVNFIVDSETRTRNYLLAYTGNLYLQLFGFATFGIS